MDEEICMVPVEEQDTENSAKLAAEIWRECYQGIVEGPQVEYMIENFQSAEAMKNQINDEFEYYYICTNCNENVGYICIKRELNKVFLSKFYIRSAHRGKGYGRFAMSWLKNLCRRDGYTSIYLTCNKYNQSALNKYHNMGFETTKSVVKDIGNGMVMDDFILSLDVNK